MDKKLRKAQGARLLAARKTAGFRSAREAALANGWAESTYRAHESGTRTIGQDDAEKYARRFRSRGADISAQAILFGDEAGGGLAETDQGLYETSPMPSGFVMVPRFDVAASAGSGRLAEATDNEADVVAFREEWMRRVGMVPNAARALIAVGDSMEPTIRDGDLLLIDSSIDHVIDNGIYVVVYGGLLHVKRLQVRRDGSVVLRSDNATLYDDEVVPAEEMTDLIVEGRVRWFGRTI